MTRLPCLFAATLLTFSAAPYATAEDATPTDRCAVERQQTGDAARQPDQQAAATDPAPGAGDIASPGTEETGAVTQPEVAGTLSDSESSSAWVANNGSTAVNRTDGDCTVQVRP